MRDLASFQGRSLAEHRHLGGGGRTQGLSHWELQVANAKPGLQGDTGSVPGASALISVSLDARTLLSDEAIGEHRGLGDPGPMPAARRLPLHRTQLTRVSSGATAQPPGARAQAAASSTGATEQQGHQRSSQK